MKNNLLERSSKMAKCWKEYNKLPDKHRNKNKLLNDLTGSEWALLSKNVNVYNGSIAIKRKMHGASFPITLAKHIISIYTSKGDTVLDPFLGVGTTTDAAQLTGRNGIGFEINEKFLKLAKSGVEKVDKSDNDCKEPIESNIIADSCLNLRKYVAADSIDLVLTSPPYCNLLNCTVGEFTGSTYNKNIYSGRKLAKPYSHDNKNDLGNMNLEEYSQNVLEVMKQLYVVSKPGSYNVWVVRDYRDMERHVPYVNLHSMIIDLAIEAEWTLFDIVIWDQTNQRKLVKLGGKLCRRFYFNMGFSFLLIFRKNLEGEKFHNGY
jgi:DNA modification methylase